MKIDKLADFVNQKLHLAKVLLDQWSEKKQQLLQQDSYFAQLLWPAQEKAFEEAVSYFLVASFKGLAYELLTACGAQAAFKQALQLVDLTDSTDNENFLKVLAEFRRQSPELSQLVAWAQQPSSDLNQLLLHYAEYGVKQLTEKKSVELHIIAVTQVGLGYEGLVHIHKVLTQKIAEFREQMQEF